MKECIKDIYNKIALSYDRELWNDMPYNQEMDLFCT